MSVRASTCHHHATISYHCSRAQFRRHPLSGAAPIIMQAWRWAACAEDSFRTHVHCLHDPCMRHVCSCSCIHVQASHACLVGMPLLSIGLASAAPAHLVGVAVHGAHRLQVLACVDLRWIQGTSKRYQHDFNEAGSMQNWEGAPRLAHQQSCVRLGCQQALPMRRAAKTARKLAWCSDRNESTSTASLLRVLCDKAQTSVASVSAGKPGRRGRAGTVPTARQGLLWPAPPGLATAVGWISPDRWVGRDVTSPKGVGAGRRLQRAQKGKAAWLVGRTQSGEAGGHPSGAAAATHCRFGGRSDETQPVLRAPLLVDPLECPCQQAWSPPTGLERGVPSALVVLVSTMAAWVVALSRRLYTSTEAYCSAPSPALTRRRSAPHMLFQTVFLGVQPSDLPWTCLLSSWSRRGSLLLLQRRRRRRRCPRSRGSSLQGSRKTRRRAGRLTTSAPHR